MPHCQSRLLQLAFLSRSNHMRWNMGIPDIWMGNGAGAAKKSDSAPEVTKHTRAEEEVLFTRRKEMASRETRRRRRGGRMKHQHAIRRSRAFAPFARLHLTHCAFTRLVLRCNGYIPLGRPAQQLQVNHLISRSSSASSDPSRPSCSSQPSHWYAQLTKRVVCWIAYT